ncbi:MAG: hypothetical protein EXR73_08560 [Myxococcales bacterium]|nr:hypothetical protein [Myxococcales bacterium]
MAQSGRWPAAHRRAVRRARRTRARGARPRRTRRAGHRRPPGPLRAAPTRRRARAHGLARPRRLL